ncbi:MAG: hypothetical protein IJJ25_06565 [Lachnospiraceae bacterium]|nr:hypothetical protein [Lachnospiraceae bacterium]
MEERSKKAAGRYVCKKCGVPLMLKEIHFTYLEHPFHASLPACPVCGNVMIDEELAAGKIAEVEELLEDK